MNTSETYSFGDICKIPGPVTWSVSSCLDIVSSNSYSVVVKGNYSCTAWITATFSNGMVFQKGLYINPSFYGFSRGTFQSETCDGIKYHYVPFTINSRLPVIINNLILTPNVPYTQNGNTFTFQFLKNYSGPFGITATITTQCGSNLYESEGMHFIQSCTQIGQGLLNRQANPNANYYKIYPNPTTDFINVSLLDNTDKPITTSTITAELFDLMEQPRRKVDVLDNTATIDVSGLPKGIYILKINIDGVIESHQVGVQ